MDSVLMKDYEVYLRGRGLSDNYISSLLRRAARFLERMEERSIEICDVTVRDIDEWVEELICSVSRRGKQGHIVSVRSLMRFLYLNGIVAVDLSVYVLGVRLYRGEILPKGIGRSEIERILKAVNRRSENGLRDYAILMFFAEYGVRVSEIVSMKIDDVDWGNDRIKFFRPKTKDWLELPLLVSVGNALFEYITKERRGDGGSTLFVFPEIMYVESKISKIVKQYACLAGVKLPYGSSCKVFRHSLAMEMVKRNVPFKLISDSLGHRCMEATYVYAKTDVERLREAALSIPGGVI